MTKYRLVKQRKAGYEPYYSIQQRFLWLFWVERNWTLDWDAAHDEYERLITAHERPAEFLVLDER